jgi:archaellum component FlaF (FlaF/FlaG flagellin family)
LLYHSATDGEVDFQKAKELWYNIPINAAKNREVYIMNKTYLSIPSHRVAQSITDICEVIAL